MKARYEDGVVSEAAKNARESIALEVKANRLQLNMTQQSLADLSGTKKSNISRMESGNYNPSLDFLVKVAESMGKQISVHLD